MGPVWVVFHRKYYVDELYSYTIIPFARGCSKFLYWVDDMWIIDPIVDAHRQGSASGCARFCAAVDPYVVDGMVNGVGLARRPRAGSVLRNTQDGQVQVYLVVVVVSVTVWLLLTALPMLLTLV